MFVSLLQPCNEPGNRLRLIPPRLKLADQMKPAHCLPPRRRILSQFRGDDKGAVGSRLLNPAQQGFPGSCSR